MVRHIATETSSNAGSVAYKVDGKPLRECEFKKGLTHSRDVMLELDEYMKDTR